MQKRLSHSTSRPRYDGRPAADPPLLARRWVWLTALAVILLVGAGLRLYRLPELPVGLHYDEAANGILAGEIARGLKAPIFIPSYTGKEVAFFYWVALWMRLLGVSTLALRLSAALVGIVTIAAAAWAVRELLGDWPAAPWVALIVAAFLATSFWHVLLSRYGFRAITQPLLQALTVAALWRGLRLSAGEERGDGPGRRRAIRPDLLWFVLAGALCGLTAYTYLAARLFPIPLAAGLLAALLTTPRRRSLLTRLAIFVAVAALVLAPLAAYWLTHPGSFLARANQVAPTAWSEVWSGLVRCAGMFFLRGDPYIRFNLPGRPLLDPVTGVLMLVGVGVVIRRLVQRGQPALSAPLSTPVFLLIFLPVMLLPSALATNEVTPSNLRTVGLMPFVYVFPAVGIWAVGQWLVRVLRGRVDGLLLIGQRGACGQVVVLALMLLVLTPVTAHAYFGRWAASAALYDATDGDLVDVARYLNEDETAAGATPYVASIHYRHPTLAFLAQDYAALRWLTGGSSLVVPA